MGVIFKRQEPELNSTESFQVLNYWQVIEIQIKKKHAVKATDGLGIGFLVPSLCLKNASINDEIRSYFAAAYIVFGYHTWGMFSYRLFVSDVTVLPRRKNFPSEAT